MIRFASCLGEHAQEPHFRVLPWFCLPLASRPVSLALSRSGLHSGLQPGRALGGWGPRAWAALRPHGEGPGPGLTQALPQQVLALARQQNKRVKAVGGGHSPSDIACTDGFMIHMGKMNRVLKVLGALGSPPLLGPMPGSHGLRLRIQAETP